MNKNWIQHPGLAHIDQEKLLLLQSLSDEGNGKNLSELFSFLMSTLDHGKMKGLHFSEEETTAILNVLKDGKSSRERMRLEKIISLLKSL